jgi:hypothetical protein
MVQPGAHAADHASIVTDRPDFVESSQVVGKGRVQVETSVLVERDRGRTSSNRKFITPTLLRYGVSQLVELRLGTDGRTVARSTDLPTGERSTVTGYDDLAVGAKWHLLDQLRNMPSVGVLLHARLPSGSRELRGQGVRPELHVSAEWELAAGLSLGVMPGIGLERNEGGARYSYASLGAVLGKSFGERLSGFVELAMPQIARAANGGTQAAVNVGGAYLLSDHVQLDAMLARGLNSFTPDWNWTVGFSFRL